MSDTTVAAPVITEAAPPASADAPVQTPAAEAQPATNAPLTRREASHQVVERIRASVAAREAASAGATGGSSAVVETGAATSPVIDNTGRAHDPANGQFTTPPADGAGTTPAGASATGAEAGATPTVETPPAADSAATPGGVPAGHVRIPVPESLQRYFGSERVVPEAEADFVRFNLNNHVRNGEVQDLQQKYQTERTENRRLQARVAALDAWVDQVMSDGTLENIQALRAVNEDVADLTLYGAKQRGVDAKADEEFNRLTEAEKATQQQEAEREGAEVGQRIASDAYSHVRTNFPVEIVVLPQFDPLFLRAQQWVGSEVTAVEAQGETVDPRKVSAEIVATFKTLLLQDPKARAIIEAKRSEKAAQQSAAERERIAAEERTRAEAAARETAEAVERQLLAASRPANNPLGNPGAVRTGVVNTGADGDDLRGLAGPSLRKAVIRRAVARAAASQR